MPAANLLANNTAARVATQGGLYPYDLYRALESVLPDQEKGYLLGYARRLHKVLKSR